jgi:FtsZ-interacting cell division protein YlmF
LVQHVEQLGCAVMLLRAFRSQLLPQLLSHHLSTHYAQKGRLRKRTKTEHTLFDCTCVAIPIPARGGMLVKKSAQTHTNKHKITTVKPSSFQELTVIANTVQWSATVRMTVRVERGHAQPKV